MPSQTWGLATSGNVFSENGTTVVGTGDGAGVITINAGATAEFGLIASNTLTIEAGVTVLFGAAAKIRLRATTTTFGSLICSGTSTQRVTLSSSQVTPGAGDWAGIDCIGGDATHIQVINMTYTTVEYCVTGIQSQNAAGFTLGVDVTTFGCIFRRMTTAWMVNSAGQGGAHAWDISYTQFYNYDADTAASQSFIQCASGGLPSVEADKARIELRNCTVFYSENGGNTITLLNVGARSRIFIQDSILAGSNAGAGTVQAATVSATDGQLTNNHNFYSVEALNQYTPDGTDQNVDPVFVSTTFPPNLSPDAQAGSPDLYISSSVGTFVGAVMPYNFPAGGDIDPEGTVGVWGGRKQRVYEVGMGEKPRRGRAIRVGFRSTDLNGEKLLAGVFLRARPEGLK